MVRYRVPTSKGKKVTKKYSRLKLNRKGINRKKKDR